MKKMLTAVLLLSGLSTLQAYGGEPNMCKSLCTSDKTSCRTAVDDVTSNEAEPMLSAGKMDKSGSMLDEKDHPFRKTDARNRKMERRQECDKKYRQCVAACKRDE